MAKTGTSKKKQEQAHKNKANDKNQTNRKKWKKLPINQSTKKTGT